MEFLDPFYNPINHIYPGGKEKFREEYPKLGLMNPLSLYHDVEMINEHQILKEFVSQTIPSEKTTSTLKKRYNVKSSNIRFNQDKIVVNVEKEDRENINKIIEFMDTFGWYPSTIENYFRSAKFGNITLTSFIKEPTPFSITFEAKYDTEVNNLPSVAYHVVPDLYNKKIERYGLTPKTKSKISTHPERIYMLINANKNDIENLCYELYQKLSPESQGRINKYLILEIDLKRLPNHKFYNDPNFNMDGDGIWTFQNIPPIYIKIVGEVEVNPYIQ
jgi:hypothetical protein